MLRFAGASPFSLCARQGARTRKVKVLSQARQGELLAERQGCPSQGGIWRKPRCRSGYSALHWRAADFFVVENLLSHNFNFLRYFGIIEGKLAALAWGQRNFSIPITIRSLHYFITHNRYKINTKSHCTMFFCVFFTIIKTNINHYQFICNK